MGSDGTARLNRRSLLKYSAFLSVGALTGVSLWQLSLEESNATIETETYDYQFLSADDRLLLWALLPAYLEGALTLTSPNAVEKGLQVLHDIDGAAMVLPQSVQKELKQLFDTLSFELGRAYLAGVWSTWNEASTSDIQAFFTDWKSSSISLFRAGYLGLHQLIMGSFYSQEHSWAAIDYQAPPAFNLPESFYVQFD